MTSPNDNELLVRAAIRDELTGPLDDIRNELRRVGDQAERTGAQANVGARGFDRMASSAGNLAKFAGRTLVTALKYGGAAIAGVTAGAVYLGVKTAASMQTAKIGFTTMLGSAKKADAFLRQLSKFAAATPFTFPELQTAASSLISVGINAKDVIPIMTTLGNVTSGMGTGAEGIQRATVALQQMTAAQAIHAEDLNQLRDAGIPVYDLLSSALGKSKAQVVALAQAGKLGKPALDKMMAALESGKGLERFNGLMQKQSESLSGVWSTLTDTVSMGLANAFQPMIPILTSLVNKFSGWATNVMPKVQAGLSSTIALGRQMIAAFRANGLDGVAKVIQQRFGVDAPAALKLLRQVIGNIATIIRGSLIPAVQDSGVNVRTFLTPVGLAIKLLAIMAAHTTTTKVALETIVVALTAAKLAHIAHVAWLKIDAAWTAIQTARTRVATAADIAAAIAGRALNSTVVQWIATQVIAAAAWVRSTAATVANTVATVASTVASTVARGAVIAWTAAQWLLNAALTANPIGLVIAAIVALVAIFVLAYTKVSWFRNGVNAALHGVLTAVQWVWNWVKANWPYLVGILGGPFGIAAAVIAKHWSSVKAGVSDVKNWIVGKFNDVVDFFESLPGRLSGFAGHFLSAGKSIMTAFFRGLESIASQGGSFITSLGKTILNGIITIIDAPLQAINDAIPDKIAIPAAPDINLPDNPIPLIPHIGDTRRSQARGRGNFANTLGVHAAIASASGARPIITNAFIGGGGRGRGSGDHQAGRALDLTGSGLGKYASTMRAAGGYAAFHGSGSGRHLHAVPPAGDTSTSKVRARAAVGYTGSDGATVSVVVQPGGITVHVPPGTDADDAAAMVTEGIRRYVQERRERA